MQKQPFLTFSLPWFYGCLHRESRLLPLLCVGGEKLAWSVATAPYQLSSSPLPRNGFNFFWDKYIAAHVTNPRYMTISRSVKSKQNLMRYV